MNADDIKTARSRLRSPPATPVSGDPRGVENPFTTPAPTRSLPTIDESKSDDLLLETNIDRENEIANLADLAFQPQYKSSWDRNNAKARIPTIEATIRSLIAKRERIHGQQSKYDIADQRKLEAHSGSIDRLIQQLETLKRQLEEFVNKLDDSSEVIGLGDVSIGDVSSTGGVAPDGPTKKTATEILADENNDAEEEFKTALNASFPDGAEKQWEFRKDKVAYFLKTAEQHMDALTDKIKRLRKVSKDPSYSPAEHKEFATRIATLEGTERHISEKRNKIKRQTFLLRAADDKIIRDTEKKYAKELQTADEDARMTIWEYLLMWWRGAERSTSTDAQFFIKIVLFLTILTSWATFFGLILDKKANSNTLSEFQKKHPELNRRGMPAIWAVFITVSFIFSSACILRTKSIIGAFWVFGFWVFVLVATNGVYQNMGG